MDKAQATPAQIEEQFTLSELYIQQSNRLPHTTTAATTTATTTTPPVQNSGSNGQKSVNVQPPQPPKNPPQINTATTKLPPAVASGNADIFASPMGTKKVGGLNIQHNSPTPPPLNAVVDAGGNAAVNVEVEVARDGMSSSGSGSSGSGGSGGGSGGSSGSGISSSGISGSGSSGSGSSSGSSGNSGSGRNVMSQSKTKEKDMTPDEIEAHYARQIAAMRKQGVI